MSFVLDALKRSEQDRHQGRVPQLGDHSGLMHVGDQKKVWWPYILIAVLALNALIFLFLHFNSGAGDAEQTPSSRDGFSPIATPAASQSAPVSSASTLPATAESRSSKKDDTQLVQPLAAPSLTESSAATSESEARRLSDIDWARKEAEAKRLISMNMEKSAQSPTVKSELVKPELIEPSKPSLTPEIIRPKSAPKGGALPFPEAQEASVGPSETYAREPKSIEQPYTDVAYLFDMPASRRPRVPQLEFNSHIFSDLPSARRVMINNIYLSEGQSFMGLNVVQIGETDIVFDKDGVMFRLPAMRDWNGS